MAGGKTPAHRKEHDQTIGAGTMSRSGAKCPCCGTLITMEDIRFEGRGGRLGEVMTAVVVDGQKGKEYRLPMPHEIAMAEAAGAEMGSGFLRMCRFGVAGGANTERWKWCGAGFFCGWLWLRSTEEVVYAEAIGGNCYIYFGYP